MVTPEYSDAQQIGNLGKRFFVGHHPDDWQQESEPQQGGDFGFDMSMWLTQLGRITGRFSVQLKATRSVKVQGARDKFVSVPLAREVCNIYLQDGQPIMLVLVALEDGNSAQSASMYYLWIDVAIQNRLGERTEFDDSDPAEMSFRIPIENKLTRDIDISDYLKQYWSHTRLANALRTESGAAALGTVSGLSPKAVAGLGHVPVKSLDRWLVNDALDGDSPWATPKPGSDAAKIKQIADYITHGNRASADRLMAEVDFTQIAETGVRSEFQFQQGRRALLQSDFGAAYKYFREAAALQPDSARHFAAELETAVIARLGEKPVVPDELLARLRNFEQHPEIGFQLVRIRALEGDYSGAERVLATLEGLNYRKAVALLALIRGDWPGLLRATDEGLAEVSEPRQEHFLNVLRLRALLHLVTAGDDEISIGGRPDLDPRDAKRLRDGTLEALRSARSAGWPANSEMLLDCASVISVIFGSDQELLDLISDLSESRAGDSGTKVVLARIATFKGDRGSAIAALKSIPTPDPQDLARLVILLCEANKYQEAVSVAMHDLLTLPHDDLTDIAVVTAAMAAYKLGSIAEEVSFRNYVLEGLQAGKSLLNFFDSNRRSPENRPTHLDNLWGDAMHEDGNEILQDNLLVYLRPDRESDVDRIISLSEVMQDRRGLTEAESARYAAALLYRERHEDVVLFTDRALGFFPKNENIGLVRAVALDHQGQSAAAEALLRQFSGSSRKDLLQSHSTLLLRVGEVEAAITILKNALANAQNHSDRFHFQRSLSTLYGRIDPEQHVEAVWRLGEIAEQTVESEEAAFLVSFVMATRGATPVADSRIVEFQERVARFSERFPESESFRVGKLAEGGAIEDFLTQLNSMLGVDEKSIKNRLRIRNIGEQSGSYIPLSLRPQGAAPYASNVMDLLRVSILGIHEGESSKILVGDKSVYPSDFLAPPIIDLVTLAALVELDLFDVLFSVWTEIAIPKISLQVLSELSLDHLSARSNQLVEKTAESVRRHRSRIVQPGPQQRNPGSYSSAEHSVISSEVKSGRFDFFSLDIAAAYYVENDVGFIRRCRTLWDFLELAEKKSALDANISRIVRLRVASWNTAGVPLLAADVAAAVYWTIGEYNFQLDELAVFRVARRYLTINTGGDAVQRASEVISVIAHSIDNRREDAIAWFSKVCFRELVLARSTNFTGSADYLASCLIVFVATGLCGHANGVERMQSVWISLENARIAFGGTHNREIFLSSLGELTAKIFAGRDSQKEIADIVDEAELRELIFSGVTPGTHDRDVVEGAYFQQTLRLQQG